MTDLPYKFEAGTPNIADTIAFGTAIDFIKSTGHEKIAKHEHELLVICNRTTGTGTRFNDHWQGKGKDKSGFFYN